MLLGDENFFLCVYFSQCVCSFLLVCSCLYHLEKNSFFLCCSKNCVFGKISSVLKGLLGMGVFIQVQDFSGVCGCKHEANWGTDFDSGFPITRVFFSYSDIKNHLRWFREFIILPSASISTWSFVVMCILCVSVSVNRSVLQCSRQEYTISPHTPLPSYYHDT